MWSTASQGQQASHAAIRLSRGGDMTMSREGEKEPHKETNQEEETEETHHREEEAEKAVTQDSSTIAIR